MRDIHDRKRRAAKERPFLNIRHAVRYRHICKIGAPEKRMVTDARHGVATERRWDGYGSCCGCWHSGGIIETTTYRRFAVGNGICPLNAIDDLGVGERRHKGECRERYAQSNFADYLHDCLDSSSPTSLNWDSARGKRLVRYIICSQARQLAVPNTGILASL